MDADMIWPMLGSLVAGGLIGLERELRGHPAGLRTHMLVAFASAILMIAAARQSQWDFLAIPGETITSDPARMAHGVLTGIGFLCAGVIFREGFSIHGLTTAASLWITSAIGILFGVGMNGLGVAASALALLVLGGLRVVDRFVPSRGVAEVSVRYLRDEAMDEAEVRALLNGIGMTVAQMGSRLEGEGRVFTHEVKVRGARPERLDTLSQRLRSSPQIIEFEVKPLES